VSVVFPGRDVEKGDMTQCAAVKKEKEIRVRMPKEKDK